jgi:hypothetical protein
MLVTCLIVGSIDPIDNIKSAIRAHEEDIVPGEILDLTIALQHNELWQNGNRLEVDGKGPEQFNKIKLRQSGSNQMHQQGNDSARRHGIFPMQKRVLRLVVGASNRFLVLDGVHNASRGTNVQYLHDGIVNGIKGGEEIQITGNENEQEEFVGANRNSYSGIKTWIVVYWNGR